VVPRGVETGNEHFLNRGRNLCHPIPDGWAEVYRAEVVGLIWGSITAPDRSLQRQKKPSVTLVFCKLRPSFSLSRQRWRVRAPSSPPLIPKILESIGDPQ